jgi:F0F1-type ATP synthase membrane subunit a
VNSRLFTFVIFVRSGYARSGDTRGDKKFFWVLLFTLFTFVFINNFIVIQGEYTVKGEQWIVHLWQWPERKRPAVAGLE